MRLTNRAFRTEDHPGMHGRFVRRHDGLGDLGQRTFPWETAIPL